MQNPNDVHVRTTDQFDHIKKDLAINDETEASVIRNSNAMMQKVLQVLKSSSGDTITEATSRRALAMAQLEAAIRQKRVAKGKTAAHETKATNCTGAEHFFSKFPSLKLLAYSRATEPSRSPLIPPMFLSPLISCSPLLLSHL